MNAFDQKLQEIGQYPLKVSNVNQIVANMTYRCFQTCRHCYIESSPDRTEMMSGETVDKLLHIMQDNKELTLLEITGGSPELNPHFKRFVESAVDMGKVVATVTDLVTYTEPGMEDIPEFLAKNKVKILASLPHYDEKSVDVVRGDGTYKKSIAALKKLNNAGYGKEGTDLRLAIVHAPVNPEIARDKEDLRDEFQSNLKYIYGITFNHLLIFINMPLGRYRKFLSDEEYAAYIKLLKDNFNPDTIAGVPCRTVVSVGPDGRFFDCDFYVGADLPVKVESTNVDNFNYEILANREIATTETCFLCTAGQGASCAECHT